MRFFLICAGTALSLFACSGRDLAPARTGPGGPIGGRKDTGSSGDGSIDLDAALSCDTLLGVNVTGGPDVTLAKGLAIRGGLICEAPDQIVIFVNNDCGVGTTPRLTIAFDRRDVNTANIPFGTPTDVATRTDTVVMDYRVSVDGVIKRWSTQCEGIVGGSFTLNEVGIETDEVTSFDLDQVRLPSCDSEEDIFVSGIARATIQRMTDC